jgi:hypothetical protein
MDARRLCHELGRQSRRHIHSRADCNFPFLISSNRGPGDVQLHERVNGGREKYVRRVDLDDHVR